MGGEGSMQAMNTIIRNNRKLLRKKGIFNRSKSISERKRELLSPVRGALEFKNVSQEELRVLKLKIKNKAAKVRIRNNVFLVVIVFVIFSITKLYSDFYSTLEKEQKIKTEVLRLQEYTKKYNVYMEDANDQFENKHWKNAVYFYKKALLMLPADSIAKVGLQKATKKLKE